MNAARHIAIIVLLFGLILAAPFIMDELKSMKTETPKEAQQEPEKAKLPPQPESSVPEELVPRRPGYDRAPMESVDGGGGGDTIIIDGRDDVSQNFVTGRFAGGSGRDTLMVDGAGTGLFDGDHINGIEIFKLQNNKPNVMTILQSGLRTAEGSVEVDGDPGIDTVKLDPEVKWEGPEEMGHMDLYTSSGNGLQPFTVAVTPGVKVEKSDAQKGPGSIIGVGSAVPMGRGNDSMILQGGDNVDFKISPNMIDGKGGKDTLTVNGAGTAALDGIRIRSFEFYKLGNKQPNVLYVFHGGLLSLESGDVFVDGDADIDTVRLDPGVKWYDPSKVGSYMRYSGNDEEGRHFTVNVSAGVKVETGVK